MKHDPLISLPTGCELCQQQISESVDSGAPLTSELRAHLAGCDACTRFAEQWLSGPPTVLAQPASSVPDAALRERILRVAAPSNVVRFPTPGASGSSHTAWLGRIAACLALSGFSYWLLNPIVSRVPSRPAEAVAPTLTQNFLQMENGTKREQQALQAAVVDSGRQVHKDVAWSMSALEL